MWLVRPLLINCLLVLLSAVWDAGGRGEAIVDNRTLVIRLTHVYFFDELGSRAALSLAVRDLENSGILDKATFEISYVSAKWCRAPYIAQTFYRLYKQENVDAVMVPICYSGVHVMGTMAPVWRVPLLAYGANQAALGDKQTHATLVRIGLGGGDAHAVAEFCAAVGWRRVALVTPAVLDGASMPDLLRRRLASHGVAIAADIILPTAPTAADTQHALRRIRTNARIVVFWLSYTLSAHRDFLLAAHDANMTSADYAFILINRYVDPFDPLPWRVGDAHDSAALAAFQRVLLLEPEGYDAASVEQMVARIQQYQQFEMNITELYRMVYPAFLLLQYDLLRVYAVAINACLASPPCDWRDGLDLFEHFRNLTVTGDRGSVVLGDTADRRVGYVVETVDAAAPNSLNIHYTIDVSSPLVTVVRQLMPVHWQTADGEPPADTPACGFTGELCVEPKSYTVEITVTLMIVLVSCAIIAYAFYAIGKRQTELLLVSKRWQVTVAELAASKQPRGSLVSLNNSAWSLAGGDPSHHNDQQEPRAYTVRGRTVHAQTRQLIGAVEFSRAQQLALNQASCCNLVCQLNMHGRMNNMQLVGLKHENLNAFIGLYSTEHLNLLWLHCQKGCLDDMVQNEDIRLDMSFKASILKDVISGLDFLHRSPFGAHGFLSSHCCLVDSRWTVRISDFGIDGILQNAYRTETIQWRPLLDSYKLHVAPEMLRALTATGPSRSAAVEMDIYGLGMIIYQVLFRCGVFDNLQLVTPQELVDRMKNGEGVRPIVPSRYDKHIHPDIVSLIKPCWSELPAERPSLLRIRKLVFNCTVDYSRNVVEHVVKKLEVYSANLESVVGERTRELDDSRRRADTLIERMLPKSVAEHLKRGLAVEPQVYAEASLLVTDVVQFTNVCSRLTPMQVVHTLNMLYTLFDALIDQTDAYKVETVGDAYLIVSGVPQRNGKQHVVQLARLAVHIRATVANLYYPHLPDEKIELRLGLHTGAVAAGVIGLTMPHYSLFGMAVNIASKLESSGSRGKLHVSRAAKELLEEVAPNAYKFTWHGSIAIKGKVITETFWMDEHIDDTIMDLNDMSF